MMTKNKAFFFCLLVLLALVATMLYLRLVHEKEELAKYAGSWTRLVSAMKQTRTGFMEVQNGQTKISYATEEAEAIFGYSEGEMEGLPISSLMPPPMVYDHENTMLESMDRAHSKHYAGARVIPVECTGMKKDGTVFGIVLRIIVGDDSVFVFVNDAKDAHFLSMEESKKIHHEGSKK